MRAADQGWIEGGNVSRLDGVPDDFYGGDGLVAFLHEGKDDVYWRFNERGRELASYIVKKCLGENQ